LKHHAIESEQKKLAEILIVERLSAKIGVEAFEADALRLARLHEINLRADTQLIRRRTHDCEIGMSDASFLILQRVCYELVEREPALLMDPRYRCRDQYQTTLPLTLWFAIVRHARDVFDPAELDAAFLAAKKRQGFSNDEALQALIAWKRGQ